MATFPILKTGAIAQYPAERQIRFNTQVLEFIDGTEQRFRDYSQALRRWVIRLDLLDAAELQAVASFFDNAGPVSVFSFIDPWDATVHASCVIESPELKTELLGEWNGRTELTIREKRT